MELRLEMATTYVDSWRKRLTLYIVMREVGEEEMMMMGWKLPVRDGRVSTNVTIFFERLTGFLCLELRILSARPSVSARRESAITQNTPGAATGWGTPERAASLSFLSLSA